MEYITLSDGKIAGYTVDNDFQITAFGYDGVYLGYYYKSHNTTYDRYGVAVQLNGNALGYLVIAHYKENNL
ncbi:MAG: hypothetical protein IKQ24_08275 [Verrucomicrobia bacterium]|nr:hypothetical protein [Verrucomicrobiota bacterium]